MATTRPKLTLEEQVAKAKLRAIGQGVRIWKLEGADMPMYAVPSSSMDGTAYLLNVHSAERGDITCTCPGHVHRGICKHMGAMLVRLDLEAEMELVQAVAAEDRDKAEAEAAFPGAQDMGHSSANGTISQDKERLEREVAELYS